MAGVRIDLLSASPAFLSRAGEYFSGFLGSGSPEGELRAEPLTLPGTPGLWEDDDPEFDVRAPRVIQRDFAARRLSPEPGGGSVPAESGMTPERAVAWVSPGLDDAFHNLLRWFVPPLLLKKSAFLLHGAAVVRDGRGYVFFGHSEAGKSTSVALITGSDPGAIPLGDDGVIVQMREQDGRSVPWVHAAPLGCGYSRAAPPALSAPIAGFYSLAQDETDRIEGLPASSGALALFASAMSVDFGEENEAKLALAHRFAAAAPGIRRLHFRKSAEFWNLVTRESERRPHV